MPFDSMPAETKHDIFSLEGLIAWLEMQDPATEYDYTHPGRCLIAAYTAANGGTYRLGSYHIGRREFNARSSSVHETFGDVAVHLPRTYGAALSRARKLLADQG